MTGYVEREGGFEAGLVLFKRHVNATPVQFAHRQKTFFSPAIEYAIPSPSPFSLSLLHDSMAPDHRLPILLLLVLYITCSVPR